MKPLVSRSLRTSFASILLASFAMIASAADSLGQVSPPLSPRRAVLLRQRSSGRAPRPSPIPQASSPTWSLPDPLINDPDLVPNRAAHSAVYDPGTNTMIVFGGADATFVPQNEVLLDSNANGSGGFEAGSWSELNPSYPLAPPRMFHSAVYDQANNRMIIFGGCADAYCYAPLNDTWVLTNANGSGGTPAWIELSPTGNLPSPRTAKRGLRPDEQPHDRLQRRQRRS